ncbi:MAG: DUF47 family protein [Bacteroidetes bacterium]|nr:DUF47 family protein [Bacteroidota bacterium]
MALLQKFFSPDGHKFYGLFDQVADKLQEMSITFHATLCHTTEDPFELLVDRLAKMEEENDVLTHKLFVELSKNFITPFDREDIHAMASGLDDIADLQYGVVRQMKSYGLQQVGVTSQYVAGEIKHFTSILLQTIKGLQDKRTLTSLKTHCLELRRITVTCDSRIDAAVAGLFPDHTEPVVIIKWMEHFQMLRALVDKCANAVGVIEAIIIKYE